MIIKQLYKNKSNIYDNVITYALKKCIYENNSHIGNNNRKLHVIETNNCYNESYSEITKFLFKYQQCCNVVLDKI